jgi:hypothetical protein
MNNNNIAEYLEKQKDFTNKRFVRGKTITKLDQLFSNFPNYRIGQLLYSIVNQPLKGAKAKKDFWNLTDEEVFAKIENTYKQICKEEEEEQSDFYNEHI